MKLGVFTQWVSADSIEILAEKINGYGLQSVVLDSYPGIDIDLDNPSKEHCLRIRRAFENAGIEIAAVGGYSNLIHQDPETRKAVHRRFRGLIRLCHEIGSPMLCSETGTLNPSSDWDWDPANATEQAYQELVNTIRPLLREAESHDVTLGFEPYVMNVIYTPERAERFMKDLNSNRAKLVMDPAGILTRANLDDQDEVLTRAFRHMSGHIGLIHVEDCLPHPQDHFYFLGAGQGAIHYPLFMDLIITSGYEGPLIMEHLKEEDIPSTREFILHHWNNALERVGKHRQ